MDPFFVVKATHGFEQASSALEAVVKSHGFGVLGIHDLGQTLRSKGVDFTEQCRIFEVCNPEQAARVMDIQMRLNMALPCRISVYTDDGQVYLGMIRPEGILVSLSGDDELKSVAREVEQIMMEIIQQAA